MRIGEGSRLGSGPQVERGDVRREGLFGAQAGPTSTVVSVALVPVFAVLTVIGVAILALFLRGGSTVRR